MMIEYLYSGADAVKTSKNIIQYNNGYAIESYAAKNSTNDNNIYTGNGKKASQLKISSEKIIVLE